MLRRILIEKLDDVLMHTEKPDPDLQALFERLHGVSFAQAVHDGLEEARAGIAAIFDELDLDVEVPELRADMTEEDAAIAAAQLADELRRADESRAAGQTARRGKAGCAAEERERRSEQLRKDTLGAVYVIEQLRRALERLLSNEALQEVRGSRKQVCLSSVHDHVH